MLLRVACSLLFCTSAAAQMSVATKLADENPLHHEFVAGVLDYVGQRYDLAPALSPIVVKTCASDSCLQAAAKKLGAKQLLIASVSELGTHDFVVELRVLRTDITGKGAVLASYSDLQTPRESARLRGHDIAKSVLSGLKGVKRAPPRVPAPAEPEVGPYDGLSGLAIGGWSTIGVGTALIFGGVTALAVEFCTQKGCVQEDTKEGRESILRSQVIIGVGALLISTGSALLLGDALVHSSE